MDAGLYQNPGHIVPEQGVVMNGADLARMLRAYDVKYVFGVPGDTNVSFYAALEALGGAVRHVLTRDERNAGYMADAYARVTIGRASWKCPAALAPCTPCRPSRRRTNPRCR